MEAQFTKDLDIFSPLIGPDGGGFGKRRISRTFYVNLAMLPVVAIYLYVHHKLLFCCIHFSIKSYLA